jgi:hypothetical protein
MTDSNGTNMMAEEGPDMTSRDSAIAVETAFGTLTIFTKDEPGPKGHKAGTTKMEYNGRPPRPITLRKKYCQARVALKEKG